MQGYLGIIADCRIGTLIAVALAIAACAAAPSPTAVRVRPPIDEASVVHEVRPGDTLSQIAANYAVDVDQLVEANQLPDSDRIAAGQILRIPISSAGTARAEALVEQAADLYRNARFEIALERARQAETILAARGSSPEPEPRALGARAAFITGCTLAAYGENEQAVAAFSRARSLDPQFEPPEGWLSPRLEKLYLAAREE